MTLSKLYTSIFTACLALSIAGCSDPKGNEGKVSEEQANSVDDAEALEDLSYTLYTGQTELFVEFTPLIVGQTSKFAAHLTKLGPAFKPFTEGQLTVSLVKGNKGIRHTVDTPRSPGIFGPKLQPTTAGEGYRLIFDVKAGALTDQFVIENVTVYPDLKTAIAQQPKPEEKGNEISYLKEQAWKVEFANQEVKKGPFYEVIKTSGQVMPAQGDEVVLTAKADGIVEFVGSGLLAGKTVTKGQPLFTVKGGGLADDNLNVKLAQLRANYQKAQVDYNRASELVKDQIIPRKEYESIKLQYETARREYQALAGAFKGGGLRIGAPQSGFIKEVAITSGQFVEAGQPIATISRNRGLVIRADVPQQYFSQLSSISSANFRASTGKEVFSLEDLNGKLVSYAKSTAPDSYYTPVFFQIDPNKQLLPGAYLEVYLKSKSAGEAIVVPESALLEEQGVYYVYVQTAGESFEKREVKLGTSDASQVQVLSGVREGERVVTKGAYQIKLATLSGAMPAHGHEH
ncbi:efflux RND transporter periplasmic adaptor subunit [Rufibacter sp. LB8]|uniref:efflux RND transporter periplasmic adaptor subunit n=1 Tax=Rufibacter sp. LB8 TaxID=2777781 RepID=UPI00178C70D8|nr:efflux RND transporter periplasmic adaptor subunit [Rufibacter sp. LB8]